MTAIRNVYIPKWRGPKGKQIMPEIRNVYMPQPKAPMWVSLVTIFGLALLGWIIIGLFGRAVWGVL